MPVARVFLSYSSEDRPFVDRIAQDLERVNVGIWYDKWEIRVGDSLIEKISEGIRENDYLALMLSPNSVTSEWVRREVNAALIRELDEKKVIILPVLIESCEIPTLLREKKYADFRKSYENGFDELVSAVSPESPMAIMRSRGFRTAQYLISGLASTDDNGTNTLNAAQLRGLYPYRRELQAFLGPEEKRLLFWSAVAFRYANRQTPTFVQVTTPVWGLATDTTLEQRATWILEGLKGILFDYLVLYYRWARDVLKLKDENHLKEAFLIQHDRKSDLLFTSDPTPERAMFEFYRSLAEDDRAIFDEYYLPIAHKDVPDAPIVIESTAFFTSPLDDDFYFSFANSPEPVALAAFKALVALRRPSSVRFLKMRSGHDRPFSAASLDVAFSELGHPEFVQQLTQWLKEEPPIEILTRILVPLANADAVNSDEVLAVINRVANSQSQYSLMPTLVRVYGRVGSDPQNLLTNWVTEWANSGKHILCEVAVFALGRVSGRSSVSSLLGLLDSDSDIILAAAMETMAKLAGLDVYEQIRPFCEHNCTAPLKLDTFRAFLR